MRNAGSRWMRVAEALAAVFLVGSLWADTVYVDANNATPPIPYQDFTNWPSAATNIQEAVDEAAAGDTILVRKGRYRAGAYAVFDGESTNVVNVDKQLILRAVDGRALTRIDGQGVNRGIRIDYSQATPAFVLDGFMVTNCFAVNGAGAAHNNGNNETHYRNCLFVDNLAASTGGGLYDNAGSDIVVSNSVFLRNRSTNSTYSAGIFNNDGRIEIYDSHFEENVSSHPTDRTRGGAIWMRDGWVENTVFLNNRTDTNNSVNSGGAAIYKLSGHATIRNCVMVGNKGYRSGAVHTDSGSGKSIFLENCTIVSNYCKVGYGKGGALLASQSEIRVHNCIVYDNFRMGSTDRGYNIVVGSSTVTQFTHNCTEPATVHPGGEAAFFADSNLTNAPRLLDPFQGKFSLHRDSPCINRGTNLSWMAGAVDLAGNRRIDATFNEPDIGAYEYEFHGTVIHVR